MKLEEAVKILRSIAQRGFCSKPVSHWLDKEEMVQYVTWESGEKLAINAFLGENQWMAKVGRHPIPSFFGEASTRTVSLMGRITYSMGKHVSPEYVSSLATELEEVPDDYAAVYEQAELDRMFSGGPGAH